MQSFSWRELLFSTSGLWGLWLMYHAAAWFWTGQAHTASADHIHKVLAQAAIGFGCVLWGVVHSVRLAHRQERARAEMMTELRASRALPPAPALEPFGENAQIRQQEKAGAKNIARGE
jgi:hypothetical protein